MANQWWARLVLGRTIVSDPLADAEQPDTRPDTEWRPPIKTRLLILLGVLALWAVAVEAQLVRLQVVDHEFYQKSANDQQQETLRPAAVRGDILDRNGRLLAFSVTSYDVHADPAGVVDVVAEAKEICAVLGDCTSDDLAQLMAKLSKPKARDVTIRSARMLAVDAADRLQRLIDARLKADKALAKATHTPLRRRSLWLEPVIWRYYPNRELGAHALGYILNNGKPGGGVEKTLDSTIGGINGEVIVQQDARFQEIFSRVKSAPVPGTTVELTLDQMIQYFADRELKAAVDASHAASGSIVVMDPHTGEILALSSYPTFNPNDPGSASNDERRNRAVQDTYEPGSTIKILTVSAALNEGLKRPSDLIDTNPGYIQPAGRSKPIYEDKRHNYGVISVEDVVVKSSNVGAIKIGQLVGPERMVQYAQAMGLGQKIAPDFVGESRGRVNSVAKLTDSALASMSVGYEVSVTPIQMAAAASVIANGGFLVEPHIKRAQIKNGQRLEYTAAPPRRAIAAETASAMKSILESVVERGTGRPAKLDRYRVAGKTGTAQKAGKGGYNDKDYYVSFVGFVPSNDPVFTILVVIDSPQVGSKYGGALAAPVFKRVADAALQYLGVQPSINPAPPVMVASDQSLLPRVTPRPSATVPAVTQVGGRPVMPDLRGMTMREAVRVAGLVGLSLTSMDGDGVVVSQMPEAGAVIGPGSRGAVSLRRGAAGTKGSNR